MFTVGEATITRVEETNVPSYPLRQIFPALTEAELADHLHWLAPHHYEAATGAMRMPVHSWLLKVGGQTILIDTCCGNQKNKPGRPFWHMLNEPYLERLAAAGARPEDVDIVMCTHLHHDHVGWNTRQKDGKWVPTFPNARYVFSKPDVDYFAKLDADPKEGPAELGTFRECVVPILEYGKADLVNGGPASTQRLYRDRAGPRPFARPCVVQAREQGRARRLHRRRLAPSAAGLSSGLEFPEEFGRGAGHRQPAKGPQLLRFERRNGVSRTCRHAVRRPCRGGAKRLPAAVRTGSGRFLKNCGVTVSRIQSIVCE